MSIVTDALNRLQSMRAQSVRPAVSSDPVSSGPEEVVVEEGSEESTRTTKFLTVSFGSFLVVASMAMGAFWWGESLVVGVPELTLSVPSHAVESPSPVVALPQNPLASDQKEPVSPEKDVTISADQPISVSSELMSGGEFVPSQGSDDPNPQQIASLSPPTRHELQEEKLEKQIEAVPAIQGKLELYGSHETKQTKPKELVQIDEASEQVRLENVPRSSMNDSARDMANVSPSSIPTDSEKILHPDISEKVATSARSEPEESVPSSKFSDPESPVALARVAAKNPHPSDEAHVSAVQSLKSRSDVQRAQLQKRLTPEQRLAKAQLLITQRSHAKALQVLNPLFATLPEAWEPWFWMGTAQLGLGDLDKAENAFMEGLVRDDTVPHLWVQRAVIDQQRGQYTLAMDALRQAELLAPDLPEVQLNLAYNLEQQGNQKLARRHYQQYLALTEGKASYHVVRRKVLERVLRLGTS